MLLRIKAIRRKADIVDFIVSKYLQMNTALKKEKGF